MSILHLNVAANRASPQRTAAAQFDPNDPRDVDALARRYAPIRYLHPEEKYGPADPNAYLKNARLREHKEWWPDKTKDGFDYGQIDPAKLRGLKGDNLYLDLRDTDAARGATPNAPSFYQYDAKSKTMTYWFFYGYNKSAGPVGNHEGDWERMTLQLDDKQQPTEVRYSSHSHSVKVPWDKAPKENGRPVAYVALGTHAHATHTGTAPTEVPIFKDHFAKGQRIDAASTPLKNILTQPWYDSPVHWGQRGDLSVFGQDFTSGPTGPSRRKGPLS